METSILPLLTVEDTTDLPLADLFSAFWTSGAMHSTAEDLARFVKNLLEGKVLGEDALEEMLTPGPEVDPGARYGYSVIIEQINEQMVYWHTGGVGYSSIYFFVPGDGLSIAILSNLMVDPKPIAIALYEAFVENQK